jgi:hypothetical protein
MIVVYSPMCFPKKSVNKRRDESVSREPYRLTSWSRFSVWKALVQREHVGLPLLLGAAITGKSIQIIQFWGIFFASRLLLHDVPEHAGIPIVTKGINMSYPWYKQTM